MTHLMVAGAEGARPLCCHLLFMLASSSAYFIGFGSQILLASTASCFIGLGPYLYQSPFVLKASLYSPYETSGWGMGV